MKIETKKIVVQFDEVGRFETPKDFDYGSLMLKIKTFKNELETIYSVEFKIDDQIEDASFICDLIIPDTLLLEKIPEYQFSIRFSNFGKLVTLNGVENLNSDNLKIIQNTLKNNDFIFLNPNELEVEYDGKFEKFKFIHDGYTATWFERYFDYL